MFSFHRSLKYLRYIGSACKHNQINSGHKHFRNLSNIPNDIIPQTSESSNSFSHCKENGKPKTAFIDTLIYRMNKELVITGLVSKIHIEQVIQYVVKTAASIRPYDALFILRCSRSLLRCTPQERITHATTLWNLFNMYHIPIDVAHYNALLQLYVENRHTFSPIEILTTMKEKGILPNETTYRYLLEYYCTKGDIFGSKTILKSMKEENYLINESIYNLLILGYSQAGDPKNAINILHIMEEKDITPTKQTYTAVMCALAKVNDIKSMNIILQYCEKEGIQFSDENILDVIYTLIINNNTDHVNKLFSKIKTNNMFTNIKFLSKLMDTKQDLAMDILFSILPKVQHKTDYNRLLHFIIDKLLHNNVCSQTIINACTHFESKYHDKNVLSKAIYLSFQHDSDITLDLLKAWKSKGRELRPHYFWPILAKFIKKNDVQGLLQSVKKMIVTYNVIPCVNTITDFVIPYVFYNILNLRNELHTFGIPSKTIDNAIVYKFLKRNKMRRAASYVTLNKNIYEESLLKDVLLQGLYNTYDVFSYFVIVNNLYKDTKFGEQAKVCINEAILDIMNIMDDHPYCTSQIIQYLCDNKTQINSDVYEMLSCYCKDSSAAEMLSKLKLMNFSAMSYAVSAYKNFMMLKEAGISKPPYLKYTELVNFLLKNNLREETKMIIKYLVIDYPEMCTLKFVLKQIKCLMSKEYFDDVAEILDYTLSMIKIECDVSSTFQLTKFVTSVSNEKEVNRLIDIVLKKGYLKPTEEIISPLVMVYIDRGDTIKALETSELLYEKYQCIPALKQLTKLIVLSEDTDLLQRFIDVTTKLYELQYILGELMLCFLENGYDEEAKRVIQLLSVSDCTFINIRENILKRVRQKNIEVLEQLLYYSLEYHGMNRLLIYKCLLHIYDIQNDYQRGLHLRTKLTKEGLSPTEDFAKTSTNLIKRNNTDKSHVPIKMESVENEY